MIKEAKEILKNFWEVRISKCHRSANEVAHELCQFGRRELVYVFVANDIPTCVSVALARDCNHVDRL